MSDDATLDEFADSESSELSLVSSSIKSSLDETSAGEVPDEWNLVRLRELTQKTLYGANESAEDYDPQKPRYIRIKDIDEQGYLNSEEKASLSPDKAEGYYLETGDMLFARSGSPGRTYLHRKQDDQYCYGGYSIKHQLISDGLSHEYLSQYTKSSKYWDWIERIARTGAQANINSKEYASLLLPLPPLSEQRKIATVLHTVDQAIQKTEEIIEQIRRVKTGIQQELFTEGYYDHNSFVETRVGTLPESWRLEKVKNYTELVSGAHVKSDLVSDDSSLTPYLTGPDDFDELGFTVTKYTDEPTKFCEAGDTLVTVKGSGCGKSTFANQRACISRQLKAIRPSDGLEELYLFYFLETKQTLLENLAEGSAIPGLSNSHLTALDIPVPSTEEQHRISETLKVYDNGIVQEKNYKSQLQRFKKGLLQDLLCGKVRTTNTNIEVPEEVAKYG